MKLLGTLVGGALLLGANLSAVEGVKEFAADNIKVTGTGGKDTAAEKPELCFDGKSATFAKFDRLNGAQVTLQFIRPVGIGELVLTQNGWGNWAHPASLEITVNGQQTKIVNLENFPGNPKNQTAGKAQSIPIDAKVTELKIKVSSVYTVNNIQWGNLGEIGYIPQAGQTAAPVAAVAAVNAAAVDALTGSERRPLLVGEFDLATFDASAANGAGGAVQNLTSAFLPKGEAVFKPLLQSRLELAFKSVRRLDLLAVTQVKNPGAAHVKELEVSVNGGAPKVFLLADSAEAQALAVNDDVRKLTLTVRSVYEAERSAGWGGFAMIGDARFAPVTFSTAAAPFPMAATALELEIDAKAPMTLPLTANIVHPRLLYRAPDLELKAGKHKYVVPVNAFAESGPYKVDWRPCHFREIFLGGASTAADPGFALIDIRPVVPAGADLFPWYDLGKFAPPSREIDGKIWTEGQSYSSGGRFGNSTYNGLLSEVVGDLWFHTYTAGAHDPLRRQKFDLYFDGSGSNAGELDSAQPWNIRGMNSDADVKIDTDWTYMRRQMKFADSAGLTYLMSTLTPGFLADCTKPLTISSRGGGDIPKRSGAPDEDEHRFFADNERNAETSKTGPTMVITPSQVITGPGEVDMAKLSEPWIVAVWGGINRPAFWGDRAAAVLFTLDNGTVRFDRGGIHLPAGRFGVSSTFHGLFGENWDVGKIRERASLLSGMLRNYPYRCKEYYRVEGDKIVIRNEFVYESWGPERFRMPNYAPLPPVMTWGYTRYHWGDLPVNPARLIRTPAGPYAWNPGDSVTYTLPVPLNRHAAFPATGQYRQFNDSLAQKFLADPAPAPAQLNYVADSWRTAYAPLRIGNSLFGMSFLGDAYRRRVLDTLKVTTTNAFSDYAWVPRKEVYGPHRYLASLWIDNKVSPAMYGDINSGVGASCYSLYNYAKYSGDWDHVKKLWPRVMDVIRFCEVVNDWAIPMTSAREGILFGGIDMDTIGFLGIAAAEQMAKQVGTQADYERLVYLRTKIAPSVALRLTFQHYLDPEGKYPQLWVNGFSESGANLEWADSKSGVGLDHVAMMLCWQGQQPEMFQFLMQLPGTQVMTDFEKVLMDRYYTGEDWTGWRKMPFNPVRTSAHLAMRCWLPGWDRAEIDRDYKIWIDRSKNQESVSNSGFYGVYQGGVDRVYLINWEPAALERLGYDRANKCLSGTFDCGKPFVLEGSAPAKIVRVELDGKAVSLANLRYEGDRFILPLPALKGEIKITFAAD